MMFRAYRVLVTLAFLCLTCSANATGRANIPIDQVLEEVANARPFSHELRDTFVEELQGYGFEEALWVAEELKAGRLEFRITLGPSIYEGTPAYYLLGSAKALGRGIVVMNRSMLEMTDPAHSDSLHPTIVHEGIHFHDEWVEILFLSKGGAKRMTHLESEVNATAAQFETLVWSKEDPSKVTAERRAEVKRKARSLAEEKIGEKRPDLLNNPTPLYEGISRQGELIALHPVLGKTATASGGKPEHFLYTTSRRPYPSGMDFKTILEAMKAGRDASPQDARDAYAMWLKHFRNGASPDAKMQFLEILDVAFMRFGSDSVPAKEIAEDRANYYILERKICDDLALLIVENAKEPLVALRMIGILDLEIGRGVIGYEQIRGLGQAFLRPGLRLDGQVLINVANLIVATGDMEAAKKLAANSQEFRRFIPKVVEERRAGEGKGKPPSRPPNGERPSRPPI